MLELWGRANAYNAQKPLWLLGELELEFQHHDIGSNPGDLDTAEFTALNPHARIPVLQHDGSIIWESNTILRYLATSHAAFALYPEDPFARSRVERWMDWELATLQPAFIALFWGYYRTPPASRNQPEIEAAGRRCRQLFELLDAHLSDNSYLAGDHFSLADIACGVCLYRYFEMGFPVEEPAQVMRWYRLLSQRNAFQNIIALPFDELEGRLEF
ncbi:MAG: glutathione S-transferase [Gammaproteobacteria bacterium]|nr:glutathione S-transferase [Gammaproteobacteria bacterium]